MDSLAKRLLNNPALQALCVPEELKELEAPVMARKAPILRYRGQMTWSRQYGIDSRMWDVLWPLLPEYSYSSGTYPTLTIEGLKQKGILL